MVVVTTATHCNEERADQRDDAVPMVQQPWTALASQYQSSTGIYQSLSLILNTGLMIYAHVGLRAVFVSNQSNIGNAVAQMTTSPPHQPAAGSTAGQAACTAGDQTRWTSVIGPHGLTGANNKTYESSFCSTGYISPDDNTQGLCLVDAPCIAK
jgi:hypothetical protein